MEIKSALPLTRIRHDLRHSSISSEGERVRQGRGQKEKERPRLLIAPRNRNQRSPLCFSPPCRVFGTSEPGEIPRGSYHRHLATKHYASSKLRVAALAHTVPPPSLLDSTFPSYPDLGRANRRRRRDGLHDDVGYGTDRSRGRRGRETDRVNAREAGLGRVVGSLGQN